MYPSAVIELLNPDPGQNGTQIPVLIFLSILNAGLSLFTLFFPSPSCVSLAATHPPSLWLGVLLCFTALGPLSPWSQISLCSFPCSSVFSSFLTFGSPYLAPFKVAEGPWMGPDSLSLPPLPTHLFSIRVIFLSARKKVSLAELKPHLLLPKPGTLPFPIPGVFAFDYSTPLRCCVVPDLWLVPGTPCLGGNAGILFSRGEEAGLASAGAGVLGWDIPSSALGAV